MSTDQARLVIIEGPDASGKTTAVKVVRATLHLAGVRAESFHYRKPTGDAWHRALDFAMQRAEFDEAVSSGTFNDGSTGAAPDVILCDRWWHSSHVEAFRLSSSSIGTLVRAEEIELQRPILVIVLDAPDCVLDGRMFARGERPSREDVARRAIYREGAGEARLWAHDGSYTRQPSPPLVVVDSSGSVEETAKRVATEVLRAMGKPVVGWDADGREVPLVR